jgi:SPP1 gp7 family putative phage head morphogenesis protein
MPAVAPSAPSPDPVVEDAPVSIRVPVVTPLITERDAIFDESSSGMQHAMWYVVNDPSFRSSLELQLSKAHAAAFSRLPVRGGKARQVGQTHYDKSMEFASKRSGELIGEITKGQLAQVQTIISRGIEREHTDEQVAKALNRVIGLDSRGESAVQNRQAQLLKSGYTPGQAHRLTDEYARQLAWSRAQTIAKTELAKAINQGQRDAWDEIGKPKEARWRWVLHPSERSCPICKSLDGTIANKDGLFPGSPEGIPPEHPNCNCTEELVIPMSKDDGLIVPFLEPVFQIAVSKDARSHSGGGNADTLKHYWAHGEGAAKIGWGTDGDFDRCVAEVGKHMPPGEAKGYCANRHHEATGAWPGHAAGESPPRHTSKDNPLIVAIDKGAGHDVSSELRNRGRFARTAGSAAPKAVATTGRRKLPKHSPIGMHPLTDADRPKLKPHKIAIPPAWTDVHVADDPKTANCLVVGKDATVSNPIALALLTTKRKRGDKKRPTQPTLTNPDGSPQGVNTN